MDHPIWSLFPWLVFTVAAGFKAWRVTGWITGLIKREARSSTWELERFRALLERNWQRTELRR